jgi:diguanylate cyclase (GGDEF)-like protein/PAS domain S-box-containing protein
MKSSIASVYAWIVGRSVLETFGVAAFVLALAGWMLHSRPGGLGAWSLPVAGLLLILGGMLVVLSAWRIAMNLIGRRDAARRLDELIAEQQAAEALAAIGSWLFDTQGNALYLSEGALRILELDPSRGTLSGREFLALIHPDDREPWRQAHRDILHSATQARLEFRVLRSDGTVIWVRSVARLEGSTADGAVPDSARVIEGILQDITALSEVSRQLALSEAKYRDLTRLSADWVWETDPAHRLSYLSESADHAFAGAWIRDGLGQPLWALRTADLPRVDWSAHQRTLDAHQVFERLQFALIDPGGELHHVQISGGPMHDEGGQFAGYRGVGRNVTRAYQQQLLLQMEGDIASVIREPATTEAVIERCIARVCDLMNWSGGVHLVQTPGTSGLILRERAGQPDLLQALFSLESPVPLHEDSAEHTVWGQAQPLWLHDLDQAPEFSRRWLTASTGQRAALLVPVVNERSEVLSVLALFSPVSFQSPGLIQPLADMLSRTLSQYMQRKQAEERLLHASLHDALTGLPNRIYLTHLLEEAVRAQRQAAVLYVDLDRYKFINDTLGHPVGDQVLIEVARRLKEALRRTDLAGRIGGDEFILLLLDLSDREEIEAVARKVLQAIERPFVLMDRAYFLSASIGIALTPDDGRDAQDLIRAADHAMYRVKAEGRNDVRFFNGQVSDDRAEQLELASEFPLALQRGQIVLYYQPVMALSKRCIVGLEGLMRWHHPTRGLLLPDRFLPVVERNNLAQEIGLWTVQRAIDDLLSLGPDQHPDLVVSVNISPRQLLAEGFLARVSDLLAQRQFPAGRLRLELTENALIDHSEQTIQLLIELRRLGIQVVIDNFGTGYASLSYLRHLPVDALKIDHTFIRGLPQDRGNAAIIQAITTLATRLGVQAMAEGVEDFHQLRALRGLDCDLMQGTFISEPLALEALEDFLETLPVVREMHRVPAIPGPSSRQRASTGAP